MDGDSAIPPYAWIAWQLRDAIRAGTPGVGEPMLSESELAEQYGVSRMTAGKVLGLLAGFRFGRSAADLLGTNTGRARGHYQRTAAHLQRARRRRCRRVCPADQHKETRLRRTAVCGRRHYRRSNGSGGRIGRTRLSATPGPVPVYRHQSCDAGLLADIPQNRAIARFPRSARRLKIILAADILHPFFSVRICAACLEP